MKLRFEALDLHHSFECPYFGLGLHAVSQLSLRAKCGPQACYLACKRDIFTDLKLLSFI